MAALVRALRGPKIAELAQRLEFLLAGLTLLLGSLLTWAVSGFRMAQAALIAVVESLLAPGAAPSTTTLSHSDTSVWPVLVYAVAVLQLIAGLYLCRARANVLTAIVVVAGFFVCLIDLLYFGDPLSKQLDAYSMACAFLVLPTALKPTRHQ
jgi:hypothetical protein